MSATWRTLGEHLTRVHHKHPLLLPWGVGTFLRLCTAIFSGGFFARDDYFHVLVPALHWIKDPQFNWEVSNIPGAGIRSQLLPRITQGLVEWAETMGVETPSGKLMVVYMVLALYASLLIPATYALVAQMLPQRRRAIMWATWLCALHPIAVYAGTRLLIEALAMPPLVYGIALLLGGIGNERQRQVSFFSAGLCFALAGWWRFHVVFAVLGVAAAATWLWRERALSLRALILNTGVVVFGASVGILAQALFDLYTTGHMLSPVLGNIAVNLCSVKNDQLQQSLSCAYVVAHNLSINPQLSRSNIFAYAGVWILMTVPPVSVLLLPALWRTTRRALPVVLPWAMFVLVHSLIGHKEERFMLPVMPLFLIWIAVAADALEEGVILPQTMLRAWPTLRTFFMVTITILAILTPTVESQLAGRLAMTHLNEHQAVRNVVSLGPELPLFYVDREINSAKKARPDSTWWREYILKTGMPVQALLAFETDRNAAMALAAKAGLQCTEPLIFLPAWPDRLVYMLNPERNRRRSPILLWHCRS